MENCHRESEHEPLAELARVNMPEEDEIVRVCAELKAISEPSRLKILLALRQGELCVYHIVQAVVWEEPGAAGMLFRIEVTVERLFDQERVAKLSTACYVSQRQEVTP